MVLDSLLMCTQKDALALEFWSQVWFADFCEGCLEGVYRVALKQLGETVQVHG